MFIIVHYKCLKRLNSKVFNKTLYGFDVETCNNNKDFYCGSVYAERAMQDWNYKPYKVFFNPEDMINEFKSEKYHNSYIFATNLLFDANALFKEKIVYFHSLFRGSDVLYYKGYTYNNKFTLKPHRSKNKSITFLDTWNYAKLSVEKLGRLINIPKLKKPASLGRFPDNNEEKQELVIYNIRDSEVTLKAARFLFDSFIKIGACPQLTIASTSMNIFRTKYLKDNQYWLMPENLLLKILDGYVGGRTEAIGRGYIENYYYYDYNSLYPYTMLNELPDPNTYRYTKKGDMDLIFCYEGMSLVTIDAPNMMYPLLQMKCDKLLFPCGQFKRWYTHLELRKALELDYRIIKIHETIYFKNTCRPFYEMITNLYNLRIKYQAENSPMEYVVKIIMNSLYGKFAQGFLERDNLVPEASLSYLNLMNIKKPERVGKYFMRIKQRVKPAVFCIPIWAAYITAFARLKLYEAISYCKPIYYDTDSLITKKKLPTSNKLGDLKLEHVIDEGIIVKPKMYFFHADGKDYIKLKGAKKMHRNKFLKLMKNPKTSYKKFIKFKESLIRKNVYCNQVIDQEKIFSLEDNKRIWPDKFNDQEFQFSEPIDLRNPEHIILGNKEKVLLNI